MPDFPDRTSRRTFLGHAAGAVAAGALFPACRSSGSSAKIKVGFLLPFTGTYADVGQGIHDAFKLAIDEAGGKLGGREIEYVKVDDEADASKAVTNTNKLVVGEKVDFLIGTVHSGVCMSMIKIVREEPNLVTLIPCAGLGAATGELCAPNVFRTSFSNWQPSYPIGNVIAKDGHKRAVTFIWDYSAPHEAVAGFKQTFAAAGGTIQKELKIDFPNVEFQAHLTEIASLKPDAVYAWFAGSGGAKFIKDYIGAGLKDKIPLYGPGFLTNDAIKIASMASAMEGIKTTLFYADTLDTPANVRFREAFKKATNRDPDVYCMIGYDTGKLLAGALDKVKGDNKATKEIISYIETTEVDSPRGKWTMSKAHNPVQDIYLREVKGGKEVVTGVAHKALSDPGNGCKML